MLSRRMLHSIGLDGSCSQTVARNGLFGTIVSQRRDSFRNFRFEVPHRAKAYTIGPVDSSSLVHRSHVHRAVHGCAT